MDMMRGTSNRQAVQEIRLKANQFNHLLMAYLRSSLKEDFFENKQGKSSKHILITQPVDLEFEMHCLEYYKAIIEYTLVFAERETTLEADLELLDQKSS